METPLQQALMSFHKDEMIKFLKTHPDSFDEAVSLAITDVQPYSWRAAWLLWSCVKSDDSRIKEHINSIVKSVPGKKDGHQRELIKILLKMKLNDRQEGLLFNVCMDLWEQIHKTPSVRVTAFKFILKSVRKYKPLLGEISYLLEERYLETLSPGVKRSVMRMINKF